MCSRRSTQIIGGRKLIAMQHLERAQALDDADNDSSFTPETSADKYARSRLSEAATTSFLDGEDQANRACFKKISADLTVDRTPIALVDLETFNQHSYPDVLLSILIKSFVEVKNWLDTAATNPASKTTFWKRWFGAVPTKPGFHRGTTHAFSADFGNRVMNCKGDE
jgi:hypothetical protein